MLEPEQLLDLPVFLSSLGNNVAPFMEILTERAQRSAKAFSRKHLLGGLFLDVAKGVDVAGERVPDDHVPIRVHGPGIKARWHPLLRLLCWLNLYQRIG